MARCRTCCQVCTEPSVNRIALENNVVDCHFAWGLGVNQGLKGYQKLCATLISILFYQAP
jgi:hypothetical protein